MENMSIYYIIGVIVGLAVVAVVFAILWGLKKNPKYDERQTIAQGKAYRAAFWTLVAYMCVNGVYNTVCEPWGEFMVEALMGICLGVVVYAVVCVFTDAYFGTNKKRSQYIVLFAVISVFNAAIVAINAVSGMEFVTDGLLNIRAMNIVVLAMFAIMFLSLLIKRALDAAQKEE